MYLHIPCLPIFLGGRKGRKAGQGADCTKRTNTFSLLPNEYCISSSTVKSSATRLLFLDKDASISTPVLGKIWVNLGSRSGSPGKTGKLARKYAQNHFLQRKRSFSFNFHRVSAGSKSHAPATRWTGVCCQTACVQVLLGERLLKRIQHTKSLPLFNSHLFTMQPIAPFTNSNSRKRYNHQSSSFDLRRIEQLFPVIYFSHPNTLAYERVSSGLLETTVVSSLVHGITLDHFVATRMRSPTKSQIDGTFSRILAGVQSLHQSHVTHTKLRPDNVWILEGSELQVTLGDYLITDANLLTSNSVTNSFVAPECWLLPQR